MTTLVKSKTEQIADIIRKEIRQNIVKIGTKMDGVRSLAQRFGVSPRSVVLAFDALEKENLIRREQGKGVFVRNWRQNKNINVFMFLWSNYDKHVFKDLLLEMMVPPHLQHGFRFNTRSVFDRKLEFANFAEEIDAIAEIKNIDCLLINAQRITKEMVPLLNGLPFPIIFLGDFSEPVELNHHFSQVAGAPESSGKKCVKALADLSYEKAMLLLPSRNILYYKMFYEGAVNAAKENGMKLEYLDLPPKSELTGHFESASLQKYFEAIGKDKICQTPGIVWGIGAEDVKEILAPWQTPKSPPWISSCSFDGQFDGFYKAVFDLIKALVRDNTPAQKIRVNHPIQIFNVCTDEPYM